MSILENFYILFKSDSKDVKKGAKEAEKATEGLNKKLSTADKKSEQVGKSFLDLSRSAMGAFAGVVSVGTAFASLRNAVAQVDELGQVSRLLNVNAEDLDAWGHAVQRSGGNAKQFQSTVSGLSKTLNATPSTAIKALPAIAESLGRMNQAQADLFGRSLGIDQSTIRFLQQGRGEVERIIKKQKELGLITKEDTIVTKKFNDAVYDLGRVFNNLSRQVALPALPALTKTFDYLIDHKQLVEGAFIAIGAGLSAFALKLAKSNPYIFAAASAISAFSLAYEDYQKFKEGQPSAIEEGFKKFDQEASGVEKLLNKIAPSFLNDESLNRFSKKFMHLPRFLGGEGFKTQQGNTDINIGDVTIKTRATNGEEIAQTFTQELMQKLTQANSNFDNGVTI